MNNAIDGILLWQANETASTAQAGFRVCVCVLGEKLAWRMPREYHLSFFALWLQSFRLILLSAMCNKKVFFEGERDFLWLDI